MAVDGAGMSRLDRIIARCEADLQSPVTFEGAGALITWRRSMAVRLDQAAIGTADIVDTTGLPADRVAQVITNFSSHAFGALVPSFEERYPARLSRARRKAIRSARGEDRRRDVTLAMVADRSVAAGILPDVSHQTLQDSFAFWNRPWKSQPRAPVTGPTGELLVGAFLLALSLVMPILLIAESTFSFGRLIVFLFFALFSFLAISLVRSGVNGLRLGRAIRRLSSSTVWPPPIALPAEPSTHAPSIEVLSAPTLSEPRELTPPLGGEVLYLWIFDAPEAQFDLFASGWVQLAPTRLLTNVELLSSTARRRATRRLRESVVADERRLQLTVESLATDFGMHEPPRLSLGWWPRRFTGYPLTALICTAGMWHAAFDALFERAGLVVVNLSGFEHAHDGLAHELRYVLRPPSPAHEAFLIDATTDADSAIEFVTDIAQTVGAAAPLVFIRTPAASSKPSWSQFRAGLRISLRGDIDGRAATLAQRIRAHLAR